MLIIPGNIINFQRNIPTQKYDLQTGINFASRKNDPCNIVVTGRTCHDLHENYQTFQTAHVLESQVRVRKTPITTQYLYYPSVLYAQTVKHKSPHVEDMVVSPPT